MKFKLPKINAQKIRIFGPPGSGKTSFAKKLSQDLNLPLYHLDKIFWGPHWVPRPQKDFLIDQEHILSQDSWILEGTSRATLMLSYPKSDVVIYLNPPRLVCLWRICKRMIFNGVDGDLPLGCQERFSWTLIKYLWGFEKSAKTELEKLKKIYPKIAFYEVNEYCSK